MPRSRPRVAVALAFAVAMSTLIATSTFAANTRVVYFGSPDCANAPSGCPSGGTSQFWSGLYPYGTGGSYDPATGYPIAGQNSFSPVTTGGATATDIVLTNASPSTLTQILLTGGKAAPATINSLSVPEMPSPPTPADKPIFNADGTAAVDSLPTGLYYTGDVYAVSNPNHIKVGCSFTSAAAPVGLFDGLSCTVGNLASLQSITLRVVVADYSAAASTTPYEPWFELGLKEGSSGTGSNSDTFFTYSELTVGAPQCSGVSNFFLNGSPVALTNKGIDTGCQTTTSGFQTTSINSQGFTNGVPASVGNFPATPTQDCGGMTCFGQESTASVALGTKVPGGLTWTIVMSGSLVPSNPKGAVHLHDGLQETIYFKHQYLCGSTITSFCWVSVNKDPATGNWTFVFESPTNGSVRNF